MASLSSKHGVSIYYDESNFYTQKYVKIGKLLQIKYVFSRDTTKLFLISNNLHSAIALILKEVPTLTSIVAIHDVRFSNREIKWAAESHQSFCTE